MLNVFDFKSSSYIKILKSVLQYLLTGISLKCSPRKSEKNTLHNSYLKKLTIIMFFTSMVHTQCFV